VALTNHSPHLAPTLKKEYSYTCARGWTKYWKKVMKDTHFNINTELGHPLPVLELVFFLE
jgi:hypothetical protein